MIHLLEWVAFVGALFNVWAYGKDIKFGALTGIPLTLVHMAWAVLTGTWAAALADIGFLGLHIYNFVKKEAIV